MSCITHSGARHQINLPLNRISGKPQSTSWYTRMSCGHQKLNRSGTKLVILTLQTAPLLVFLAWLMQPPNH